MGETDCGGIWVLFWWAGPWQHIKKQRHYFTNKGPSSQSYGFSSSHVWMWELDHKESWALKNWCFWTVVLEKTLESPLDCKIKPVNHKGNQSWIFIGKTDAEAEALILCLATWCKELTHWKIFWCWERLKAGREGDTRGWDGWMASPTLNMSLSKLRELVIDREAWRAAVHGVAKSRIQLSNWTELTLPTARKRLGEASLVAQLIKNPPAMQKTLVWFLSLEDPPEKG